MGATAYPAPAYYSALNGPVDTLAWLVDQLLASPNQTMSLLPGGQARAEKLTDSRGRQGRHEADADGLGDLWNGHLAAAGLGGCEQQVLRLFVLPALVAGSVRGRAPTISGGAVEGDRGAHAGNPREAAQGRRRVPSHSRTCGCSTRTRKSSSPARRWSSTTAASSSVGAVATRRKCPRARR